MALNVTTPDANRTMSTEQMPAEYVAPVWPLWLEVTVPIVCVVLFVLTLVIIFYKPSKPGDEPLFYIPLTKCKHQPNTEQPQDDVQANNTCDSAPERDVVIV